ncbi:MAG: polysaccharide deacetylase family protein [Clostridia bacterium]|nr:polysaccharide deacetylase family protein [Clostridia bacterium]
MRIKLSIPLILIGFWLFFWAWYAWPTQTVGTTGYLIRTSLPKNNKIIILMYHKVNPFPTSGGLGLRVNPSDFAEQMSILKEFGYTVISMDKMVEFLETGKPLPERSIVITFDDGYEDNYLYAYPILMKYGYPATIFLVYNHIDETNSWDEKLGFPSNHLLNWDEIREMAENGITFGSHTLNHPHLDEIPLAEAAKEITISKILLEKTLKKPVNYFCYPYGDYNLKVAHIVKLAGYKAAVTTRLGVNENKANPYTLKRVRVMGTYDRYKFIRELERIR